MPVPPVSQFEELSGASLDKLKWKLIARPGGASMRPADYYRLRGLAQQAEHGDNDQEKPMWAEHVRARPSAAAAAPLPP